ncbi:interferon-induced protein with tetratricopeptide repeats 5-like [Vipera latastei]
MGPPFSPLALGGKQLTPRARPRILQRAETFTQSHPLPTCTQKAPTKREAACVVRMQFAGRPICPPSLPPPHPTWARPLHPHPRTAFVFDFPAGPPRPPTWPTPLVAPELERGSRSAAVWQDERFAAPKEPERDPSSFCVRPPSKESLGQSGVHTVSTINALSEPTCPSAQGRYHLPLTQGSSILSSPPSPPFPHSRPLKEKLQRLQCHFTWDFEVKDKMNIEHCLVTLSLRLEHGPFHNRGTYLALKAYLRHLEGSPKEALDILQEAKEVLRKESPETFSRQVLLVYGDSAWICYHLTDYDRVDLYLGQICQICRDLSSPEPYSAPIPEVYAQKGWSLLAMGFRNGQLARQCFQKALELQEPNAELEEGLVFSTFAFWTHFPDDKLQEECQKLLKGLIRSQPENYEAKVRLAQLLCWKDPERAQHLANDVVQNSLNPEHLRIAAKVIKIHSTSQAISTLKKAITLQGDYYLLHYELGMRYMYLLDQEFEGNRAEIVEDAIECFKRSLEFDPRSVFSRLKLAKLYGERRPLYEEEVYLGLMEELPTSSKRCQQSFYLHWGDFLLRKKGQRQAALRAYEACLEVPGDHPVEQKQLEQCLNELARAFRSEGEMEQERAVQRLLREMAAKHWALRQNAWRALPSWDLPQ